MRTWSARKWGFENIAARWSPMPISRAVAGAAVSTTAPRAARISVGRRMRRGIEVETGRPRRKLRFGRREVTLSSLLDPAQHRLSSPFVEHVGPGPVGRDPRVLALAAHSVRAVDVKP